MNTTQESAGQATNASDGAQINGDEIEITLTVTPRGAGLLLAGLEQLPLGVASGMYNFVKTQTELQVGAYVAQRQLGQSPASAPPQNRQQRRTVKAKAAPVMKAVNAKPMAKKA